MKGGGPFIEAIRTRRSIRHFSKEPVSDREGSLEGEGVSEKAEAKLMRRAIPAREECLKLMDQYEMLENIVSHSIEVARVALLLSKGLNKKGQRIDLLLVEAASLLHDLAKTECLKTKEDHAWAGSNHLNEMGFDRVGAVMPEHVLLSREGDPSSVSEEAVVNYADKRAMHDRIVSLKERFKDLRERYGRGQRPMEYMDRMEKAMYRIENKIFLILQIDPNDLQRLQTEGKD